MSIPAILNSFAQDSKLAWVLTLIFIDLVLGVSAAFYTNTFSLAYIAKFLHDDVLGKVVPWFVVYAFTKVSGNATAVFGIDFNIIADGAFALVVAALLGSFTSSLAKFGIPMPAALARGERTPNISKPPVGG